MWRSTERAALEKNPSTRLSQEPRIQLFELDPCRGSSSTSAGARRQETKVLRTCRWRERSGDTADRPGGAVTRGWLERRTAVGFFGSHAFASTQELNLASIYRQPTIPIAQHCLQEYRPAALRKRGWPAPANKESRPTEYYRPTWRAPSIRLPSCFARFWTWSCIFEIIAPTKNSSSTVVQPGRWMIWKNSSKCLCEPSSAQVC